MRFLISVIDNNTGTATSDEMVAIDSFNDLLRANGNWIFAGGLSAPADAIVIDNRNGADLMSHGPLHSSDDYISGLWLIEANDLTTAQDLAAQGSRACNRRVELRPLLG